MFLTVVRKCHLTPAVFDIVGQNIYNHGLVKSPAGKPNAGAMS